MGKVKYHPMSKLPKRGDFPGTFLSRVVIVYAIGSKSKELLFYTGAYNHGTGEWYLDTESLVEASCWTYFPIPAAINPNWKPKRLK